MSLPAPLARGLLVTVPLAGLCLALPASGQFPSTQPHYATGQSGYSSAYPATSAYSNYSGYSGAQYYQAQAPADSAPPSVPEVPQTSPSDAPGTGARGNYVPPPPQGLTPAGDFAYPPPQGAPPVAGYGSNYYNDSSACNCPDGGYSTFGLWGSYAPTSPCSGGPGYGWGSHPGQAAGSWLSSYGACDTSPVGYGVAGCAEGCATCQPTCQAACRVWFGGVYGLFMTRDDENVAWTSFDSGNLANQVLSSRDASDDWQPGNEIRFGSTLLCHCLGWEAVYWGLYEEHDEATITATDVGNPVSSVFDFGGLDYDDGGGVSGINSFFDGAQAHRVRRHFELQNVELNLLYYPLLDSVGPYGVSRAGSGFLTCRRFSIVGSAGVRYLRIDEGFQLASSLNDTVFGNEPSDMFYEIEMENHLIGFQLGAAANYQATQRLSFFADTKFGLFGNYIDHDQRIFGSNGFAVVTAGLPFAGEEYNIQSDKEDVAFLGELRVGVGYWVTPHWRLYGGWRAIGIAGYAHPTDQIPLNFAGTPDIRDIDSNGSLIVHGLQTGVEMNY